jgi:hypothetical protein
MRIKVLASAEFPVAESEVKRILPVALPIGKSVFMAKD